MSKPTLLCIDDVPEMLRAYQRMFKDEFDVVVALDPEQAAIHAERADVILSDWHLDGCTARDVLLQFPHKPTVVVSGHPGEVRLEHAWLILQKGSDAEVLKSALREALGV